MEWKPETRGLNELLNLLQDAIHPSNRDRQLVQTRLASFNAIPEYNSYLVHILAVMTDQGHYIRSIAGLTLKNNLINNFNQTPLSVLDHVKTVSLKSLDSPDPDPTVRKTIGSVISAIIRGGQVMNWPESIKVLVDKLNSSDALTVEMALDTVQMVCEDNAKDISQAMNNDTPVLDYIIPRLIHFSSNPNIELRVLAISAINHFIPLRPPSLIDHLDTYLHSLLTIASEPDLRVRQEVCRSFVMLLDHVTTRLLPYMDQLIEYMIFCNQSEDAKLAMEACDFWQQFSQLESIHYYLEPYLTRVIPVILNALIYTDQDLAVFGKEEEDINPQDLPLSRYQRAANARYQQRHTNHDGLEEIEEDDDDDDDDEDEDPDDEEFFSEWTLRKLSATLLETLACTFKSRVTNVLLPLLGHALFNDDWRVVESGILALSAAAEGCMEEIVPHLPRLMPYLITNLSNANAHVRSITCWTVSRFSGWIVAQCSTSEKNRTQYYEPVLWELLRRILDGSKRVQVAACSAFSTLEEHATNQELVPYLPGILNHLTHALRLYRTRNLRLLYDTIGTLAESVGPSLNEQACISVLMPPLISRWKQLKNTDSDLFPLLTCLTDIATSLGRGFLPFTEIVFTRCVMLVSTALKGVVHEDAYGEFDELDDDFIVVPLDLLSGIVQGLGNTVEPFVTRSTLLPLLAVCAHYDSRYEVLSPTYALIGDLAKACFATLDPYLDNIMPELIRQISNDDPAFKSVRNNAIWAVGEISIRWTKERMRSYVEPIMRELLPLIYPQSSYIDLQENTVNTIGRLGILNPDITALALPQFGHAWLYRARGVRENDEKDSAFQGFCKTVGLCPYALNEMAIRMLFDAIRQWKNPSPALQSLFEHVTTGYRGLLTVDQWNQVSSGLIQSQS